MLLAGTAFAAHFFMETLGSDRKAIFGFAILMIFGTLSHASELYTSKIEKIKRPLSSNSSKNFDYSYQVVSFRESDAPTVIYIPGGPGDASINHPPEIAANNIILTDPRGVGENRTFWSAGGQAQDLSSEEVAEDIMAIIRERKIKKYSIYGISYGTVVATILASKIEQAKDLAAPVTVILEGTVGPAHRYDLIESQENATNKLLKKLETEADYCLTCVLEKKTNSNGDLANLTYVILAALGNSPDNIKKTVEHLDIDKVLKSLKKDTFTNSFSKEVTEKEIAPNNARAIMKADPAANEISFDLPVMLVDKLTKPYSPQEWPIKAPLIYIQGSDDTLTPPEKTIEHFESQALSHKMFLCIKNGSHNSTMATLSSVCSSILFAVSTKIINMEKFNELNRKNQCPVQVTDPDKCF